MKNLDTLIQDIYFNLEGLSSGEALNISEEELYGGPQENIPGGGSTSGGGSPSTTQNNYY